MRGVITGKDVVLQAFTIVRLWGLATWLACVRAALSPEPTTFLAVLYRAPPCVAPASGPAAAAPAPGA